MIINASRPGCCDEECGTAKQDAGWRPAAAIMIIMHPNQGAVTGKRGAGWQPAVATVITMHPNRGAVTGHVAEQGAGR